MCRVLKFKRSIDGENVVQQFVVTNENVSRKNDATRAMFLKKSMELLVKLHPRATGCHLQYGITLQWY